MKIVLISTTEELQTHAPEQLATLKSLGAGIYEKTDATFSNIAEFSGAEQVVLLFNEFSVEGGYDSLNIFLRSNSNIKYIFTPFSRFNVDLELIKEKGITFQGNAGANKTAVAQFALSLYLQLLTKQPILGKLNSVPVGDILGQEITSLSAGIIGFGNVGQKLGAMLAALGVKVKFYNRSQKNVDYAEQASLNEVLKQDSLFITIAGNEETKSLFTEEFYSSLKDKYLVDVGASDNLYDKNIVVALCEANQLKGYALEVQAKVENIDSASGNFVKTPHMAWATEEAEQNTYRTWLQNALDIKYTDNSIE